MCCRVSKVVSRFQRADVSSDIAFGGSCLVYIEYCASSEVHQRSAISLKLGNFGSCAFGELSTGST